MPDLAVKNLNINTNSSIEFYKIGKSNLSVEDRFNEIKQSFSQNNLIIKFYENTAQTKVKSIRSVNIIYGSDLDCINLATFENEALFDKPNTIENDDTLIKTKSNTKHYYELTTNYPKFTTVDNWGGIFEEEEVLKIDGTSVLIASASTGTELKSYFINGAPDTDVVSEFMSWSYPGSSLPSGSYETSSVVVNNIQQQLSNNTIFHLTMEDGSEFRASGGTHLLVYDIEQDALRYESVSEIDETKHKLINLTGGLANISSSVGEILDGEYKSYIIDMETTDTYFLYNGELSVKIVTHNCFPAGTKITLANGDEKNIEDLTINDKLLTYNEKTGVLSEGSIGNILKKKEFLLIQLETEDGSIVKSTPLHKFYIKGKGWIAAQDIVKGDNVIKKDKSESIIVDRKDLSGEVDVYHIIDVKDNHTYFAEGILVHNFKYGSCFPAGTKILTNNDSEKNIEDIVEGDDVLSFNENTLETEIKRVIGTKQPIHNDLVKYTLSDGSELVCTFDHPIYVNNLQLASYNSELTNSRYDINKEVNKIKLNDVVRFADGGFHAITNIEELPIVDTQTYIITVEDNHNFFANNILVHNK
jgi:intein/homing endonuclease